MKFSKCTDTSGLDVWINMDAVHSLRRFESKTPAGGYTSVTFGPSDTMSVKNTPQEIINAAH